MNASRRASAGQTSAPSRPSSPTVRVAAAAALASATVMATTWSTLGRSLIDVLVVTAVAAAGVFAVVWASRWVLGPSASLAAPAVCGVLCTVGVATVERLQPGSGLPQAVAAGIGAALYLVVARVAASQSGRWPTAMPTVATVVACGLLLLPFVPGLGRAVGGAHLAVHLGPVSGQPGEFARPLFAILLASAIAAAGPQLREARGWLPSALRVSVPLLLAVLLSGAAYDFGPVLVLGVTTVVLLLMVRPTWQIVVAVVVLPLLAALVAGTWIPTVHTRIVAMIAPVDAGGLNQIGYGLRAYARGGWFGTGVGQGHPTLVKFSESDFVMAAIAEERGVLTVVVVLGLYAVLARALWFSAARAAGESARAVAAAMALLITVQATYTTLGVLGVVPLTGMTVPFVSLGGSAMLGMWATVGVAVGLGASATWRAADMRPIRAGAWGSAVALTSGVAVAVSVAVHPPVPAGSALAPDWAARRGPVLAADGVVLARTDGGVRTYPEGGLYTDVVGYTMPGAGSGLEESESERYSCATTFWNTVTGTSCRPPALVTTLSPAVQHAAAGALDGLVGDAVAVDVSTGALLAAYSSAPPDPGGLTGPGGDAARAGAAGDLRRRAGVPFATYQTSPGSVFKIVVAAAALRAGVATTTPVRTSYTAPGGVRPVHNAGDVPGGGTLATAIAESSNTAFGEIATRVGQAPIASETAALTTWDPADGATNAAPATIGADQLDPDGLTRTGFGQQGVRASPLDLAAVAATVAGGGEQPVPHAVAGTCDGGFVPAAVTTPHRVLSESVAATLGAAMRRVVTDGHGGALGSLDVPVAAKTGTAERPDGLYDGLVIAYAPAAAPRVAVAVRVEADPASATTRSGAVDAAPVAAALIRAALAPSRTPADPCPA